MNKNQLNYKFLRDEDSNLNRKQIKQLKMAELKL